MSGFTIILWVCWAVLVGRRADKLGRNSFIWFIISLLISPLISWIVLEIMGRTDEIKKLSQSDKSVGKNIQYGNEDWQWEKQDPKTGTPKETDQLTEVKHTDKTEILNKNLIAEPSNINNDLKDAETLIERKTISLFANLQTPQKIIFSVSCIALSFILFYAFAQSIDNKVRIKETWFVWIIFIILQTWLQNKFWSSGITLTIPNMSRLRRFWINNKSKLLFSVGTVLTIIIILLLVEPINNYLRERAIEQNNYLKEQIVKEERDSIIRVNASIVREITRFCEYYTISLKTKKNKYDLHINLVNSDDIDNYLKIKITAKSTAYPFDEYPEILPGESFIDAERRLKKDQHSFASNFSLIFHTKKYGDIKYHIDPKIMIYDGDYKEVLVYNGDTIAGKSHDNFLNYHQFSGEQYINMEGKKEAFLSIDSITADTVVNFRSH